MKNIFLALSTLLFSCSVWAGKTVDVEVTRKGFEPARIQAKVGEEVTLNITRKVKVTCATEITIPSLDVNKKLPLNKTVTVKVTPKEKGEISFGCAMNHMLGGVLDVI